MGVGVTMVHCEHRGMMSMWQMLQMEDEQSDNSCEIPAKNCMTLLVSKLSPTSQAQSISYDFHAFQPLLFVNDCGQLLPKPVFHLVTRQIAEVFPHGPPRDYLSFIRILII